MDGEKCQKCPACLGFPILMKLQSLVNHVDLLPSLSVAAEGKSLARSDEPTRQSLERKFLENLGINEQSGMYEEDETQTKSQKLFVLVRLLRLWKEKRSKVLVFSHSTEMLNLVQQTLARRNFRVDRLDGSMSRKQRTAAIKRFKEDYESFAFLISTKGEHIQHNVRYEPLIMLF